MTDDLIIGLGGPADPQSIPLATKLGNPIKNRRRQERSPEQLRAAVSIIRGLRIGLELRSISSTYNCFGMVFACRRTCIIDGEEVVKILSDDGYREVRNRTDVMIGDIIIYRVAKTREISHAGVVVDRRPTGSATDLSFMILSQWGADGEYLHHEDTILPQLGDTHEFWSERKAL